MPPSRSGPDPAEPAQGPFNTGSEINAARNPSRASPAATPMAPVTSAGAVVSAAYRSLPAATKVPTMPAGSAALADIGPTTRWRELPTAAYSTSAGTAAYRPTTGGTPAMVA